MAKYKHKISKEELAYRQSLPLFLKKRLTFDRIREFCNEYGMDGVYVSFSGGKDSRVLLDIAREYDSKIKAVYLDTWLEFPEIRQYVKQFDNVDIIKPQKSLKQIIKEDGWCFPSKDIAEAIMAYRRGASWAKNKLNGLDKNGKPSVYRERYKKWLKVAEDCPVTISHRCCLDIKERPVARYEKETGRHPIVALLADESARRAESYLRTGCNSFDGSRPISKPMGFWTEQDVLHYVYDNHIDLASPYGEVYRVNDLPGQLDLFNLVGLECSTCSNCRLKTSGESRTGCIFCPVAGHLDNFAKLERLKVHSPKLYDYCMEELGEKELVSWVRKHLIKS